MVVLEAGNGGLEAAALDQCLDALYAQSDLSLKVLHKRYIGLHQWVSPIQSKEVKLQLVCSCVFYYSPFVVVYWSFSMRKSTVHV